MFRGLDLVDLVSQKGIVSVPRLRHVNRGLGGRVCPIYDPCDWYIFTYTFGGFLKFS